jgi:phosphatidylserine/phosphatidylglycerophosphate/cardiolipin synthase-like enzyme
MDTKALHQLSLASLQGLAQALMGQCLILPLTITDLIPHVPDALLSDVFQNLNHLISQGFSLSQVGTVLNMIAQERIYKLQDRPPPELVWTGPEVPGAAGRDTRVVVQELFEAAQHTVLVSTYAIDQNTKADEIFKTLADRMDANPKLTVQFFVNLMGSHNSPISQEQQVRDFSHHFRDQIWPGQRLPEVFYDPRSISNSYGIRACLHSKCVIIDETTAFISSANFTEAAHNRNIEAGVLIKDRVVAKALQQQFQSLVAHGQLLLLPVADFTEPRYPLRSGSYDYNPESCRSA